MAVADSPPLVQPDSDSPRAAGKVPLSAARYSTLCSALQQDFSPSELRQLAHTEYELRLENLVALDKPHGGVVDAFVRWAILQPGGVHGLLEKAQRANPRGPELAALTEAWQGLVFDLVPACPYPGLRPFTAEQSTVFFGRDHEIELLRQRILKQPLVVVIGPSGSGKSSLLRAGVLPALRLAQSPARDWVVRELRPGAAPAAALAVALEGVWDPVAHQAVAGPLLVVIDQFEEAFAPADGPDDGGFCEQVAALAHAPGVKVVIAVRADFYERLLESPLWHDAETRLVPILPLDRAGLAAAIAQPAQAVGVNVEPALVERLLGEAAGARGVLPFLQETLVMLWGRLTTPLLTLQDYAALTAGSNDGRTGLQLAMALHADETLQTLADQLGSGAGPLAQRCFLRLVQFGDGGAATSRAQTETELRTAGDDPALLRAVLGGLVANRLLTSYADAADQEPRYVLAHDKLIDGWPRLQGWLRDLTDGELQRRRLEYKATEHQRLGPEGGLLDAQELQEADAYVRSAPGQLLGMSDAAAGLVAASRKAIDPGWNRWGLLALAGLAVSAALWLGVVYLATLPLDRAVAVAVWAGVAALAAAALLGLWQGGRRRLFWLQHMTHTLGGQPVPKVALGALMVGSLGGYAVVGMPLLSQVQYCQGPPRLFERPAGDSIHVALVNGGIDSYSFAVVQSTLATQQRIRAWSASNEEARACPLFFQRVVHLKPAVTSAGETTILADVEGVAQAQQPKAFGASCFAVRQMAAALAETLDSRAGIVEADLGGPALASCKALALNEDGVAALNTGAVEQARTLFLAAVAEAPSYALAYVNLGDAYKQLDNLTQAAQDYQQAIDLAPTEPVYLERLAFLRREQWKRDPADRATFDTAEALYRKILELDPNYIFAYTGLANLLIMGDERLDEAEGLLATGLRRFQALTHVPVKQRPEMETLLYKNLGLLAMAREQYAHAVESLLRADAASAKPDRDVLLPLARAYDALGATAEGCAAWLRLDETLRQAQQSPAQWIQDKLQACR